MIRKTSSLINFWNFSLIGDADIIDNKPSERFLKQREKGLNGELDEATIIFKNDNLIDIDYIEMKTTEIKSRKGLFVYFNNKVLSYLDGLKNIYIPLFIRFGVKIETFNTEYSSLKLYELLHSDKLFTDELISYCLKYNYKVWKWITDANGNIYNEDGILV